jgi:hypothetical protein
LAHHHHYLTVLNLCPIINLSITSPIFTTWSMLLSRHCQEIWSSTVIMLIILLKSLTRISQFMTLCWWFYFQIGLRIL